jgi:hypothetical protein
MLSGVSALLGDQLSPSGIWVWRAMAQSQLWGTDGNQKHMGDFIIQNVMISCLPMSYDCLLARELGRSICISPLCFVELSHQNMKIWMTRMSWTLCSVLFMGSFLVE